MRQLATFKEVEKGCMEMPLLIAVQFVGGKADYLVKVDTPIFGIFLLAVDLILHNLLTMCSALTCNSEGLVEVGEASTVVSVIRPSVIRHSVLSDTFRGRQLYFTVQYFLWGCSIPRWRAEQVPFVNSLVLDLQLRRTWG